MNGAEVFAEALRASHGEAFIRGRGPGGIIVEAAGT